MMILRDILCVIFIFSAFCVLGSLMAEFTAASIEWLMSVTSSPTETVKRWGMFGLAISGILLLIVSTIGEVMGKKD